jgi:putative transposase
LLYKEGDQHYLSADVARLAVSGRRDRPALAQGSGLVDEADVGRELVLGALLMVLWRRKPSQPVIVHSDQGLQYGGDDWQRFCRSHGLQPNMSRRGNCWGNAVVESFFSSLKKERIRKRICKTRDLAQADVFDYIEVFYNRPRRHGHLDGSPEDFEQASA